MVASRAGQLHHSKNYRPCSKLPHFTLRTYYVEHTACTLCYSGHHITDVVRVHTVRRSPPCAPCPTPREAGRNAAVEERRDKTAERGHTGHSQLNSMETTVLQVGCARIHTYVPVPIRSCTAAGTEALDIGRAPVGGRLPTPVPEDMLNDLQGDEKEKNDAISGTKELAEEES